MSCSSCARIRRRIRELAEKARAATAAARRTLRASKTGGTAPASAGRDAKASHSRVDAYGQRWEFDELYRPIAVYPKRTGITRRKFLVD